MKLFDASITPEEQQLAWYVDRVTVLDDLTKRLKWEANVASKVVVYHGPGGIGKTSVRKMAESILLKPAQIPYVVVDYEPDGSPRSAEATFSHIRRQLGRFGLRFPAFDLVWVKYWEETTQQRVSTTRFPSELEDAADVLSVIPVLGNVPQAVAALTKLSQSAAQWISQRFGKGGIARLQQMNAIELTRMMPEALARDLEEMMENQRHRGKQEDARITVMFDGFERLDEHGVEDWFIREFCQASGSTLKVVFGREMLKWERYNPIWQKYIDHHPALSNLSPADAGDYLKRRGIDDQVLGQYLIELTDGFPYHLRLAADLCQQIEETTGLESTVADFRAAEKTNDLGETLLSSLLRQLDKDEYDAAMLASIPRWFNKEIIELLVAEPASAPRFFETLTRFSFCEAIPNSSDAYILRKEARRLLRNRAKKLRHWITWNKHLCEYHAQHRSELTHLAEEMYHGFIIDPDATLILFQEEFYHALNAWRFGDCWILIQSLPPESEIPTNVVQRIKLARVALLQEDWKSRDRLETARTLIHSLLRQELLPEIQGRAMRLAGLVDIKLDDRHRGFQELQQAVKAFDELNDLALKASALRDLGDLYFTNGDFRRALTSHEDAISALKQLGKDSNEHTLSKLESGARVIGLPLSDSLRAIASLYARTGRTHLSVQPLEEMLAEGLRDGNTRIRAEALSELGLVYRRLGRLDDAKRVYKQAIPLFDELRAIPGKAHVLCGLGMTLEQGGNIEAAQPYFEQSLRFFEEIGDTYGKAKIWHCFGRVHHKAKNYNLAQDHYSRSLRLYRELGHIVNTGPLLFDLAKLHLDLGNNSEAFAICKEALGIFESLEDEIAVAATHVNLGSICHVQNKLNLALEYWLQSRRLYIKHLTVNGSKSIDSLNGKPELIKEILQDIWVNWLSMYDPSAQVQTLRYLDVNISAFRSN